MVNISRWLIFSGKRASRLPCVSYGCIDTYLKAQQEFVLSKQLLRSGTSVGAMVRESEHAQTRSDFIHKLAIAQKEINESLYWLELLVATDYLGSDQATSIQHDATELLKLLTSSLKTAKANMAANH